MSKIHQPMERQGVRPTPTKQLEDVWTEIRKLWKGVNQGESGRIIDVPFSLGGVIYASTSGGWYPPFPMVQMTSILTTLRVAGTTDTTVSVYRNLTTDIIATITLTAGTRKVRTSVANQPFQGDQDECFVAVTTAGAGAQGLTVQPRFRVL